MQISLALSGGAARGAFHLGVLDKFDEIDIEVKAISGASIGAFIAVAYGSGVSPKETLSIIKSKEFKKTFKLNFNLKSFVKIDENSDIVRKFTKINDLKDMPITVIISATDLNTNEVIYFSSGDTAKIVLGSCAIVPMFSPIKYDKYNLVDGCFVDNLPAKALQGFNYPIVAVDLQPLKPMKNVGVLSSTRRALEIALTPSREKLKEYSIYITDDDLSNYSFFSFKKFDEMFEMGRKSVSDEILKRIENAQRI